MADVLGSVPVVKGIDHVALAVRDPDAAVDWFVRRLGLITVNDELVHADVNVRLIFLAAGDANATTIQLVSPIGPGDVATHLRTKGEGLHHVCFKVDDVRRALDRVGEPSTPTFVGGYGLTCAFLRQPTPCDTNIELVGADLPGSPRPPEQQEGRQQ